MSRYLHQQVKITCESSWTNLRDEDGHRLRDWKVTLVAIDNNKQIPGKLQAMLDHVEYNLHPSFLEPKREIKIEPYSLVERGWGEFTLRVTLHFKDNFTPSELFVFDLNFKKPHYSETHRMKFYNISPEWTEYLAGLATTTTTTTKIGQEETVGTNSDLTNPVYSLPLDEETCLKWDIPIRFNMVELARRMALLSESQVADLYTLIQLHQTNDMTVKEKNGQLTMDLYSLGTPLLNRLWEFTETLFGSDAESWFSC